MPTWPPHIVDGAEPKYLRLAASIGDAIRSGELRPGVKLPPHRDLAYRLSVSVGTVARAYDELAARGLVRGEIGRGTIILDQADGGWISLEREFGLIDLGFARSPPIDDEALVEAAGKKTLTALGGQWSLLSLGQVPPERGEQRHRRAASGWLADRGVPCSEDTTIFTIGGQEALSAALMALTRRGDAIFAEALTISSLKDLAVALGLTICPVDIDEEGMCPDDLERQAKQRRAKVAVVQPNLHIPTTAQMSEARRRAIAAAARRTDLILIEYEGWGSVIDKAPPSVAAFAPERVLHVDALSNCIMPGLRAGILHAPQPLISSLTAVRHAMLLSTPRLLAEVATYWIATGLARDLANAVARVNERRIRLAKRLLGELATTTPRQSPLLWLDIGERQSESDFVRDAERRGVRVLPSERFTLGRGEPGRHVRIALCSATDDTELARAIELLRGLLPGPNRSQV